MKNTYYNVMGWFGASLIVIGFTLISFEIIKPTDLLYQVINVIGATGIFVNAFHKRDYPAGSLNLVFTLIALVALLRIIF